MKSSGLDVIWTGDWEKDPGDKEIIRFANREKRVLITLDKDFGELAILSDEKHCGIVRLVNIPARKQAETCLKIISSHGEELLKGAIITADMGYLRIRPPEL